MGWENRDGRRYYYRKHRVGESVYSEYIGKGLLAEIASEQDELLRYQLQQENEAFKETVNRNKEIDSELDSLIDLTRIFVRASLLLSGYHPHKGQWRKKRNG